MSKRRKIIIVLGVLFCAFLLVALFTRKKPTEDYSDYQKVHSNIQSGWQHNNKLYFYTGSYFATYDLSTQKVNRLSDYLLINQDIGQLKWSESGVVFSSRQNIQSRDDLSKSLDTLNIPTQNIYWWWYDFDTKQYQLLENPTTAGCQETFKYKDRGYICAPLDKNRQQPTSITELSSDGKSTDLYKSEDTIHDIKLVGQDIYFISTQNDGSETLSKVDSSKQTTSVYDSAGKITSYDANNQGDILLSWIKIKRSGDESHENKGVDYNLVLRADNKDVAKKKINTTNINIVNTDNTLSAISSYGLVYNVSDHKLVEIATEGDQPTDYRQYAQVDDKKYYLTSTSQLFSSTKVDNGPMRTLDKFDSEDDNDSSQPFFVNTPDQDGVSNVQLYSNTETFIQQGAKIEKLLLGDSFEPSEFKFVWLLDTSNPDSIIKPNVALVK